MSEIFSQYTVSCLIVVLTACLSLLYNIPFNMHVYVCIRNIWYKYITVYLSIRMSTVSWVITSKNAMNIWCKFLDEPIFSWLKTWERNGKLMARSKCWALHKAAMETFSGIWHFILSPTTQRFNCLHLIWMPGIIFPILVMFMGILTAHWCSNLCFPHENHIAYL